MHRIFRTALVPCLGASLLLSACEKGLETYEAPSAIYFLYAVSAESAMIAVTDNKMVTFGYSPETRKDSILRLPVQVTGAPANTARSYKLGLADSSTAKEGTDFEFVSRDFTIDAGQVRDTIAVKLLRTSKLLTETVSIHLKLEPNEHFNTNMLEKKDAMGKVTLRYNLYSLRFTDILTKPKYWLDGYLGPFSRKKLLFICDLNNFSPTYLDGATPPNIALLTYYGRFTQRYLNEMRAAGNTIYDEDGTEMVMGPNVQ